MLYKSGNLISDGITRADILFEILMEAALFS